MTRLTNHIKAQIVGNAIKSAGIPKKRKNRLKSLELLAEKIRVFSLGGKDEMVKIEKLAAKIETITKHLPECIKNGAFNYKSYVSINLQGCYQGLEYGDSVFRITRKSAFIIESKNPLAKEWVKLEKDRNEINDLASEIHQTVMAAMSTSTTVKKLLSIWPECKSLLPTSTKESAMQLPSVRIEDVNKLVRLK